MNDEKFFKGMMALMIVWFWSTLTPTTQTVMTTPMTTQHYGII